jgi:hypothetical protein
VSLEHCGTQEPSWQTVPVEHWSLAVQPLQRRVLGSQVSPLAQSAASLQPTTQRLSPAQ